MGRGWLAVVLALACGSPQSGGDGGEQGTGTGASDDATSETPVDLGGGGSSGGADGSGSGRSSTGAPLPDPPEPPYPIVLAHGFFGFDDFAGLDFVTYFHGVVERLQESGEAAVFVPTVDPFNDSTVRGEQLLAYVEEVVGSHAYGKVNIIGHSQGGLDARVVASLRPDLVASVTTIATPHGGTPLADISLGLVADPGAAALVDALVQAIGAPIWDDVGNETSLAAALHQMSSEGIAQFNDLYPDGDRVAYYSVTGRSDYHTGGDDCSADVAVPFVSDWDEERDPIDPLFAIPEAILDGSVLDPIANDGLIRARDSKWGTFLGCVPADHIDEVGQLLGDEPGTFNDWDHLDFYVDLVAHLRSEGH